MPWEALNVLRCVVMCDVGLLNELDCVGSCDVGIEMMLGVDV